MKRSAEALLVAVEFTQSTDDLPYGQAGAGDASHSPVAAVAEGDARDATGLEWQTTSPPPKHNFDETPIVTAPPYDYVGRQAQRLLTGSLGT